MAIAASPLQPETVYDASRTACHRDHLGIPFFNIYISYQPNTVSRKYAYTDDLAIVHADGD